uniref:prostaglandin E synthase-like n=1 Tax=Styela clava TaxID=7725 RepID=UPI001939B48B|nr:prostaglandin E synthase-like [Styela clava]
MLSVNNIEDELIADFGFYACILLLEIVFISFKTGQARLKNKSFATPEDAIRRGGLEFYRQNEKVERLRRIHRNDLENIPAFLFVSALYILTGPSQFWYKILMRSYAVSRILYTCSYMNEWRAPARSVIYCVGMYLILLPMLIGVLYASLW